jgi:hypothetical protein
MAQIRAREDIPSINLLSIFAARLALLCAQFKIFGHRGSKVRDQLCKTDF